MPKKDSGKKTVLPAIGKPKPKPKKTSVRDIGKTANSQFKQGYADKDKKLIGPTPEGKYVTAKEDAIRLSKYKKPLSQWKGAKSKSYEKTQLLKARITGV